jgi:glycosyltransferase involved in cell wall biosynthesis
LRLALIAPPFIPVPPKQYGGTELFIAQLAVGLKERGIDVTVYTNGESEVDVAKRWLFAKSQWPITGDIYNHSRDYIHTAWSLEEAGRDSDLIHVNNATGITFSEFVRQPLVCTLHHPLEPGLTDMYKHFRKVDYVCISQNQCELQGLTGAHVIHHGIDTTLYQLREKKKQYLSFIGRIAPVKGVHLAIEVAKKSGIPLKIAGEVQPMFQDYFDSEIKPHIDRSHIEFIGEADLAAKNELLGDSLAMLFPIEWEEPFGLVMVEAMACGTPVLALPAGSVPEIVRDGVSGFICKDVDEMATRAEELTQRNTFSPSAVRKYVEEEFSIARMVDSYIALYEGILQQRRDQAKKGIAVA